MRRVTASEIFLGLASVVAGVAVVGVGLAVTRTDAVAAARGPATTTAADRSPATSTTTAATTTTTAAPSPPPPPAVPPLVQPAPALLPPAPGGSVGIGSAGPEVQAYQQRLADLHIDPGAVDGSFDDGTRSAVWTVQLMLGLPTSGRIGAAEVQALANFRYPAPRAGATEPKRVEIDLAKQVLTLYDANQVRLVTRISSGGGYRYCHRGGCEQAVTPTGHFAFYTRYRGWQHGYLGALYNPVYFKGGIAVHGATSVPLRPASHGCTRIPMSISEYFPSLVAKGDAVYVMA